jgi:hypothetical protein
MNHEDISSLNFVKILDEIQLRQPSRNSKGLAFPLREQFLHKAKTFENYMLRLHAKLNMPKISRQFARCGEKFHQYCN